MLLKANQTRSLVVRKGEFDWRSLFGDETVLNKSLDGIALTEKRLEKSMIQRMLILLPWPLGK